MAEFEVPDSDPDIVMPDDDFLNAAELSSDGGSFEQGEMEECGLGVIEESEVATRRTIYRNVLSQTHEEQAHDKEVKAFFRAHSRRSTVNG